SCFVTVFCGFFLFCEKSLPLRQITSKNICFDRVILISLFRLIPEIITEKFHQSSFLACFGF
ncbi:hypothetical protein, partial [Acetobacter cerevisiae]|uniref:hypothetical protein n=1 Tax=Acetobacter cerevisiae TaxID=178900 RepID=UPI00222E3EDC